MVNTSGLSITKLSVQIPLNIDFPNAKIFLRIKLAVPNFFRLKKHFIFGQYKPKAIDKWLFLWYFFCIAFMR